MSKLTNPIGWCDETTNAVTGCDKVSPGCKNCYAAEGTRARVLRAQGVETWGPRGVRHPVAEYVAKLRRLNKLCICNKCATTYPVERLASDFPECWTGPEGEGERCGGKLRRIRLFADSNSDWLDHKWPVETLAEFLKAIHDAPNVDVLLLTKRPGQFFGRMREVISFVRDPGGDIPADEEKRRFHEWLCLWSNGMGGGRAPDNVWLGVSVEDQERADERITQLLCLPAAVRFLSCEPLLEDIDIQSACGRNTGCDGATAQEGCVECGHLARKVDWVIVGGESGLNRRDYAEGVDALVNVAEQCVEAGVPVYVKQDCALFPGQQGRIPESVWGLKQFPAISNPRSQIEDGREALS